jgi:uncharacterized membrane protein
MARTYGAIRGLSRFEGFTDAVFAIALTLLIVAFAAPRIGAGIALLTVAWFLHPQPHPRYRPGQEPREEEKEEA